MHARLVTARRRVLLLTVTALGLCLSLPLAGKDGPAKGEEKQASKDRAALVKKRIEAERADLLALYRHLHSHPELSLQEVQTSARLAKELTKLGFKVTTQFGGHGVVGVYSNGKGPTVLVRTDMDALPVTEKTGVSYASKVRVRDKNDNEVGVMHACGHDMHMTCWVGAARVLVALKDQWKGTLVFIGQPAEEIGTGARLMLEAGLFKKFPKPDYCLALHCNATGPHGTVGYTEGLALANVDSVDITVKGKGGHGAAPHTTVDPIVLAARIVLDLQTLVSRETNPTDPAVVTVGSIHGGTKHNIIPSDVKLQLTVRSTKDKVRAHLLAGIKRIAEGCARAANAPAPVVKVDTSEFTPALYNDPALTRRTVEVFKRVLGAEKVSSRPPVMGGEDFSRYGQSGIPVFLFWLGTVAPQRVAEAAKEGGKPLPSLHSELFAPVPVPTIDTGVLAMSSAVLELMGK
jgi:hippurate hydrolase